MITNTIESLPPFGAAILLPEKVLKSWGYELIFYNEANYCSKMLVIEPYCKTSMHYHDIKHETITVINGILELEYIENKKVKKKQLYKNQSIVVPPGFAHRLCAKDKLVELVEASTHSVDKDSIRLENY